MSKYVKRVVWSEGLLLTQQHFQQHERYLENIIHECMEDDFTWGFKDLSINKQNLSENRFGIEEASGIMPDGTFFRFDSRSAPPFIEITSLLEMGEKVYLCLPLKKEGLAEIDLFQGGNKKSDLRCKTSTEIIRDNTNANNKERAIDLAELNFKLLLESDDRSQYTCMPVIRIARLDSEIGSVLDEKFIPPVLRCSTVPVLAGIVNEIYYLLLHKSKTLADHVIRPAKGSLSNYSDFLLLQVLNRVTPLFAHFSKTHYLHPKVLYRHMLQLAGEIATFTRESRLSSPLPDYLHSDIENTLTPILGKIKSYLNVLSEQPAINIDLVKDKSGIYIAAIYENELLSSADFVLAAKADIKSSELNQLFQNLLTIASLEEIENLVSSQVSGIGFEALPVAPSQIPYHAGFSYYILDSSSPLWNQVRRSAGIALHMKDVQFGTGDLG